MFLANPDEKILNSRMNCVPSNLSHSEIREPHKKMQADVEMESPREDKVARFPKVVPMEHNLADGKFYVRDCYDEYYTRVLALLKGPRAYAFEEAIAEFEEEEEVEEELEKKEQVRAKIEELKEERAEIEDAQEPRPGEKHGVTITGTPGKTAIAYSPGRSDFAFITVCVWCPRHWQVGLHGVLLPSL
jgi:hypothetical protein